jgi:phosphoglycolate phosphatase-like HAD superfamily hydrolase
MGADRILCGVLKNNDKGLRAFEYFLDHQNELAQQMKIHKGVLELLEKLHSAKIPMAVVTGRHSRDLEIVLRPRWSDSSGGALGCTG